MHRRKWSKRKKKKRYQFRLVTMFRCMSKCFRLFFQGVTYRHHCDGTGSLVTLPHADISAASLDHSLMNGSHDGRPAINSRIFYWLIFHHDVTSRLPDFLRVNTLRCWNHEYDRGHWNDCPVFYQRLPSELLWKDEVEQQAFDVTLGSLFNVLI